MLDRRVKAEFAAHLLALGRLHCGGDGQEIVLAQRYIVADLLGRQLLAEEALAVGTSARGYALRAEKEEKTKWSSASGGAGLTWRVQ